MKNLKREDIDNKVIIIRINKTYKKGMDSQGLYECTRGFWSLNPEKASEADYALAVYQGEVLEVYEIDQWYPAGTTEMKTRKFNGDTKTPRFEFTGKVANEEIRSKYVHSDVSGLFSNGAANPIRYFF